MSGFQNKEGGGALFKNEEKNGETEADYKGTIMIKGQEYWLNAWINTAASNGKKYFKLSANPKQTKGGQQRAPEPQKTNDMDFDDDIPF